MAAFSYQAIDATGKKVKGVLEGDSERQIRSLLRQRQLRPLSVKQAKQGNSQGGSGLFNFSFGGPSLKSRDVTLITRQLASLVQSGLPLDEVLAAAAKQSKKPALKTVVLQIRSRVLEGLSLAQAMSELPKIFDTLYLAMIKAGESSGYLGPVLDQLADYTENSQETKQKVKSAMVYPMVMIVVAISVVTLLMVKVVPQLMGMFERNKQDLPMITEILIGTSNFLVNYGFYVFMLITCTAVAIAQLLKDPKRKQVWHRWQLKLPIIGEFVLQAETARYASTLGLLAASGVPLVEGLKIASEVLSNTNIRAAGVKVAVSVQEGMALHSAMDKVDVFPPLLVQMVASGEANGKLDEQLVHVARNQERELRFSVDALMGLMEPAMILVMGGVVGFIVMAILSPMFEMNQMVR